MEKQTSSGESKLLIVAIVFVALVAAGVFLVLYGTCLGTEGAGYRWMRRYGVVFYFRPTRIAMPIVSDQMRCRRLSPGCQ